MENWKTIKGYEGYYEVSNLGNVRALTRKIHFGSSERIFHGKEIAQSKNEKGYLYVRLHRGDKFKKLKVHRLVAEAFIAGDTVLTVNHKDGNKKNNRAENLEWLTQQENVSHAINVLGRKIGRGNKLI